MARSYREIVRDLDRIIRRHTDLLDEISEEATKAFLRQIIRIEREIAKDMYKLLNRLKTEKNDETGKYEVTSEPENLAVVDLIVQLIEDKAVDLIKAGREWVMRWYPEGYKLGGQFTTDIAKVGDPAIEFAMDQEDAMILRIAMTKGYGKELGGIGKIKEITMQTETAIRDIILRGMRQRKGITEIAQDLYSADTGLSALEIVDSRGVRRILSLRQRCELIARNEVAEIYQIAAEKKSKDIFGDDPYWRYGSVIDERISEWCLRRFGRVARVSQWNDPRWVKKEFGDTRTGTGHIHVNCRQSGYPVSPDWFDRREWREISGGKRLVSGSDEARLRARKAA